MSKSNLAVALAPLPVCAVSAKPKKTVSGSASVLVAKRRQVFPLPLL